MVSTSRNTRQKISTAPFCLATLFADDVYAALSGGETLGDAVLRGRAALVNAEVSDWANYVLYGDADFQLVRKM